MRRFNFFQAWSMSFFSRDLYADVGRNWKGFGWAYLFLLIAVTWLPASYTIHSGLTHWARTEAPQVLKDFPRLTITKGVVTADRETPYVMNDDAGRPVLMIDLTGQNTTLEASKTQALLTKNKLIMRQSAGETRMYDLSNIDNFWVDRDRILGWLNTFSSWFALLLFPFLVAASFVFRVLQNLIYAGLCLAFAQGMKSQLQFNVAMRLAAVAVTPAIIVDTLADLVHLRIPFFGFLKFGMTIGFLYFAARSNRHGAAPLGTMPAPPVPPPLAASV